VGAIADPSTRGEADSPAAATVPPRGRGSTAPGNAARLARAATDNFEFIWRVLRRLGVRPDAAVDDAVQRVFEIAARKVEHVKPGAERAFLFKTAALVAVEERRRQQRARNRDADETADLASDAPDPERALVERRNRVLLDELLDSLPDDARTVFVLFELEGMTCAQIGELLGIPEGTANSRLRRGRERFHAAARRLRARLSTRKP
jgi:RNA polymerase sigma-70 factor (ECF subfamily)